MPDQLSISLPDASPQLRAAILADLQLELFHAGASPQDVDLLRDPENMDFGATLLVALAALAWKAAGGAAEGVGSSIGRVVGTRLAQGVLDLLPSRVDQAIGTVQRKYHRLVEVKTPSGSLVHYGEAAGAAQSDAPPQLGELAVIIFGASDYPHYPGDGVNKDGAEAVRWYRKSAEAGDEFAKTALRRPGK